MELRRLRTEEEPNERNTIVRSSGRVKENGGGGEAKGKSLGWAFWICLVERGG